MIMDSRLDLADAVALNTGAAGSYLIGSQIDLGVARDIGVGGQLYLVIQVHTAATSGGSATGAFELRSDATAAVDVSTGTLHFATAAIAVASLVAGYQFVMALPMDGSVPYERFLGLVQVTGTAAFTAGKVDAFITANPPAHHLLADGAN